MMTDAEIVAFIVAKFEGGRFTNDPLDPGGPTKWGVTQRAFGRYLGRPATVGDVQALTFEQACDVHHELSMVRNGLHQIADWRLKFVTVDASINFGDDDAFPWLQKAVGVTPDAHLGTHTWAAVAAADPFLAAARVLAYRQRKHLDRVLGKPNQVRFLDGWLNRCTTLLERIAA